MGNKTPLDSDSPVLGPCSQPHSGLWFLFCNAVGYLSVWSVKLSFFCPWALAQGLAEVLLPLGCEKEAPAPRRGGTHSPPPILGGGRQPTAHLAPSRF